MSRIEVAVRVARPGIAPAALRRIAAHILRRERAPAAAVGVALVDDRTIRALNRRYLGRDRVTDVLAFPMRASNARARRAAARRTRGEAGRPYLGEVVISVDRARVQAGRAGHGLRTEIALLAVHGLLHLLGYDDRTARGARQMADRQRRLLADAGQVVRG